MKKYIFAVGAVAFSIQASAALSDKGDFVLDTNTNLVWLKLPILNGYSYDEVSSGSRGYISDGWRFANSSELLSLLTSYVSPVGSNYSGLPMSSWTEASFSTASALVSMLGSTYEVDSGGLKQATTQGFMHTMTPSGPPVGFTEVTAVFSVPANSTYGGFSGPSGRWGIVEYMGNNPSVGQAGLSSFLVKDVSPIPEPAQWILLVAGVCAVRLLKHRHAPSAAA